SRRSHGAGLPHRGPAPHPARGAEGCRRHGDRTLVPSGGEGQPAARPLPERAGERRGGSPGRSGPPIRRGRSLSRQAGDRVGGGPGAANPILNGDFESGDEGSPNAWDIDWRARRAGYHVAFSTERPKSGRRSLLFSWEKPDPSSSPQPGEPLVADLGGGVSA